MRRKSHENLPFPEAFHPHGGEFFEITGKI